MTLTLKQIKRHTPDLVKYFQHGVNEQPERHWDICLEYAEKFQRLLNEPNVAPAQRQAFATEVQNQIDYGTAWIELVVFVQVWAESDTETEKRKRSREVVVPGKVIGTFDGRSLKRGETVHLYWNCPLCGKQDYEDFYNANEPSPILRSCQCERKGQENFLNVHFEYVDPSEDLEPLGEESGWQQRAQDFVNRKDHIHDEEIPKLLGWLQNVERPGVKEIGELLLSLGDRCLKPVQQIFRSTDDAWVHGILLVLVRHWPLTLQTQLLGPLWLPMETLTEEDLELLSLDICLRNEPQTDRDRKWLILKYQDLMRARCRRD